jgi:ribosomal-protein-alanine N-acetyltransferase
MSIKVEITSTPQIETIAAVHNASFARGWSAEAIRNLLEVKGTGAFIMEDGSGFALVRLIADEAEVLTLCVLKEHRRKGSGSALVKAFIGWAKGRGAVSIFLEVNEHNEAARLLYERHGFAIVARRNEYYRNEDGSHEHALVMRLSL